MAAKENTVPSILAGDLNDVLGSRTLKEFRKSWTPTNAKPMPTVPVGKPTRQIDFILFKPAARWKMMKQKCSPKPWPPIIARFLQSLSCSTSVILILLDKSQKAVLSLLLCLEAALLFARELHKQFVSVE